jgi:hypothetical protein
MPLPSPPPTSFKNAPQVLNPYIAYAVAAYAMIEGCKTVPFDADRATVAAH